MIDYRFGDDFLFLLVPASPKIGPFENHHNQWNADANKLGMVKPSWGKSTNETSVEWIDRVPCAGWFRVGVSRSARTRRRWSGNAGAQRVHHSRNGQRASQRIDRLLEGDAAQKVSFGRKALVRLVMFRSGLSPLEPLVRTHESPQTWASALAIVRDRAM